MPFPLPGTRRKQLPGALSARVSACCLRRRSPGGSGLVLHQSPSPDLGSRHGTGSAHPNLLPPGAAAQLAEPPVTWPDLGGAPSS
ncbi:hypothetical protein J1605_011709 [Eschrichtius robustus]|uniref:Uncharacterized protein n=1 Tax=Eschrichtius robustus TaxID=9764 RepID=A0AB34GP56_ESCRO|nr:hypothetical protein J1605_011709 [Eschrichtius robustus]